MDATSSHNSQAQTSPDDHRPLSLVASLSPTLVNDTHHTGRPPLTLRIPGGASNILNSTVVDPAGQPLYSTLSDSKRTKLVSYSDSVEVATIQWDRHSPRMVFRHKKMKCKEWLKLAGPNNESRILTHGNAQFTWVQGQGSASGHLIPADRPGLAVARWQVNASTDDLILEISQEASIESGLLEAIVLSVVLLRSGYSLGDSSREISLSNPTYSHLLRFR